MAIVNHSGNIEANETWAATDEHHITANCLIGDPDPGSSRILVTIESNSQINYNGDYTIYGRNDINAKGEFRAIASDWCNKIFISADPTNFPNQQWHSYNGFSTAFDLDVTLKYCHITCSDFGPVRVYPDHAGGLSGNVNIQKCFIEYCDFGPELPMFNLAGTASGDYTLKNCIWWHCGCFWLYWGGTANRTFNGTYDVERHYVYNMTGPIGRDNGPREWDYPFPVFKDWVFDDKTGGAPYGTIQLWVTDGHTFPDFKNCYFYNGNEDYALFLVLDGDWEINIEECVVWKTRQRGFNYSAAHGGDFWLWYCDFIECTNYAIAGINGSGKGNIISCYEYGNRNQLTIETDTSPDAGQHVNIEGTCVLSLTLNKPLDAETTEVSNVTPNSARVTFNSKAGPRGTRCDGAAFVRYGTSSGNYTHETIHPQSKREIALAWSEIDLSKGQFKQTGHVVDLEGLQNNTTYYFKPCFIGPLGRIAEGAEETFTTLPISSAPGGTKSQFIQPVGSPKFFR